MRTNNAAILTPEEILFGNPKPSMIVRRGDNPFQATEWVSRPMLSPRLQQICKLVMEGKSNKQIAVLLNLSPGTVKVYCCNLYLRLGVKGRYELMALCFRHAHKLAIEGRSNVVEMPGDEEAG